MTRVIYQIVEHDGGWAYKVGDVFSETFPTHGARARCCRAGCGRAADSRRDAARSNTKIRSGQWHEETARGDDRPDSEVKD